MEKFCLFNSWAQQQSLLVESDIGNDDEGWRTSKGFLQLSRELKSFFLNEILQQRKILHQRVCRVFLPSSFTLMEFPTLRPLWRNFTSSRWCSSKKILFIILHIGMFPFELLKQGKRAESLSQTFLRPSTTVTREREKVRRASIKNKDVYGDGIRS